MSDTELIQNGTSSPASCDFDRYFQFLSDNPSEVYTYCWMDAESKGVIAGYGVMHGRTADMLPPVSGATLHVVLGITDLKGKKKENIQGVRVFCVDLDKETSRESLREIVGMYKVQFVVESSVGKFHLYWRADPKIRQEQWRLVQAGLARLLGGDINLSQINHSIRVPGIVRVCKDGAAFVPRVVWDVGEYEELGVKGLEELTSKELCEWGEKALGEERKDRKKIESGTKKAIASGNVDEVAAIIEKVGKRNEGIFSAVFAYVGSGGTESRNGHGLAPVISEEEAVRWAILVNEGLREPLDAVEVVKTARSACERAGWKMQQKNERDDKVIEAGQGEGGEGSFKYNYESDPFLKKSRFSEKALISRIIQRFPHHLVRTGELIYAFDNEDKVWRRQKKEDSSVVQEYVEQCCLDTVNDPRFGKEKCRTKNGEESLSKRALEEEKWLSHYRISSSTNALLKSTRLPRKDITSFDSNPYMLFCGNGVLNILTGEINEPRLGDFMLQRTPTEWKPEAECPFWLNFLQEVFAGNANPAEMCTFMQELFGYSITGGIGEQKVFVHTGGGSNGKSKLLQVLRGMLGGYSSLLGCTVLSKSKGAVQKEFDRIGPKIEGKRAVIVDDLDTKTQWNEGFVKSLTGPTIPSRHLYAEERDIPNRAKIHIGCNTVPAPESENYGILRRVCIIPYAMRFDSLPEKDREINENTVLEMSGILRWAVEGVQRMKLEKRGISYPSDLLVSQEEYKSEYFKIESAVDTLFKKESEKKEEDRQPTIGALCDRMNDYLRSIGSIENTDETRLGKLLTEKGYKSKRLTRNKVKYTIYYVKQEE